MSFLRVHSLYNDVTDSWLSGAGRPEFERRRLVIAPGAEHASSAGEWADALVLLERGSLEVECLAGARRAFQATAILCLGWLPLRTLRSMGSEPAELVALRRRRDPLQSETMAYHGT